MKQTLASLPRRMRKIFFRADSGYFTGYKQTKNQIHASQTLTDDFSTNDILWQLAVLGYNLSVTMRYEANSKIWRQEHLTFFRWFINVPGKIVKTARKVTVKMSRHYWYTDQWRDFEQRLSRAC